MAMLLATAIFVDPVLRDIRLAVIEEAQEGFLILLLRYSQGYSWVKAKPSSTLDNQTVCSEHHKQSWGQLRAVAVGPVAAMIQIYCITAVFRLHFVTIPLYMCIDRRSASVESHI